MALGKASIRSGSAPASQKIAARNGREADRAPAQCPRTQCPRGAPFAPTNRPPMPINPPTEIAPSDLKAARLFLTSFREEERAARAPRVAGKKATTTLRAGIARARDRAATIKGD